MLMVLVVGSVPLFAVGTGSTTAYASCAEPPAKLVWSYPEDGASDVPTNAHIFYETSLGSRVQEVSVNGVVLSTTVPPGGPFGLAPVLEPNTAYVVGLKIRETDHLTFSFKTGAGIAGGGPPAPFEVKGITPAPTRELSPRCAEAVAAMDCFDTGQNTHLIFNTDASPVAFFVSSRSLPWNMSWPGQCGAPEVFVRECAGPYTIYAVSATGETSVSEVDCTGIAHLEASNRTSDGSAGCSMATLPSPSLPLQLLTLVPLLGTCRARRRAKSLGAERTAARPKISS
jgi:hypothetical protein